jgi:hypothetical protein
MDVPEPASKTLNAVRSPLVFNALITLLLSGVVGGVLYSSLPTWFRMSTVGFFGLWIIGMTMWTYIAYRRDPRGLAYGPNEYIEESRMAYEHKLALAGC